MHCETLSNERAVEAATDFSEAARGRLLSKRGEPLFLADWRQPVFVHFEVPADTLRRAVPFEIDLHDGKAFVSLVAFTMERMRPFHGGRPGEWLLKPIARNDFLNFRTYVRHRGEPGIHFLTEWMNNRVSVRLGPWTFGLPYRFGELRYANQHAGGCVSGLVRETEDGPGFRYNARLENCAFTPCPAGSLDEFLLERYTAFTAHGSKRRFFRIWHRPWVQQSIGASTPDTTLIEKVWPWFAEARLVGANFSPGARDVWMGRPHVIGA